MTELYREDDVREFIKRLPELSFHPPTTHLVMLTVRSRKARSIMNVSMKDVVVERRVVRITKKVDWRDRYFAKVHNLAMLQEYGYYNVRGNLTIPQVMGIYGTISPRSVIKSIAEIMHENVRYLVQRDDVAMGLLANQYTRFASKLHANKEKGQNFATVDIDMEDKTVYDDIMDIVSPLKIMMATHTSRGYHIVLDLSEGSDAAAYFHNQTGIRKTLREKYPDGSGIDLMKDSQEPIPGTRYFKENGDLNYVEILQ